MQTVVVFALYLWLALSVIALVAQQVRRMRRFRTERAATTAEVAASVDPSPPVAQSDEVRAEPTLSEALPRVPDTFEGPPVVAPSFARTLAGIRLPCDLAPIAPRGVAASGDTINLLSTSAPLEVVGPAIADELERLGYALDPVSVSRVIARRGADALTLDLVASPDGLQSEGLPLYPEVGPSAVLLVIRSGRHTD
jgi:hypothetical protein